MRRMCFSARPMQKTPDNWDRAKELFEAALEFSPSQRAAFLAENCPDDSLRQQIEKLLTNYQAAGSFLDEPVLNPRFPTPIKHAETNPEEACAPHPQSGDV